MAYWTKKRKESFTRFCIWVSFGLHVVWFIYITIGVWRIGSPFPSPVAEDAAADRVDIIATALALLGVVIGLSALLGFVAVRREAIAAAKEECRNAVSKEISDSVKDYFLTHGFAGLSKELAEAIRLNPDFFQAIMGGLRPPVEAEGYADAFPNEGAGPTE